MRSKASVDAKAMPRSSNELLTMSNEEWINVRIRNAKSRILIG